MRIGICGAGWLGKSLALSLLAQGHQVSASKRNLADLDVLNSLGINAIQFALGDRLSSQAVAPLLSNQLLIVNIAPGRRSLDAEAFIANMQQLISHAFNRGTEKLIFISTTSVYGESPTSITETTIPAPTTESAKAHVAIEQFARDIFKHNAAILRLSGLVGEDRHPIRTLAGKQQLSKGAAPVNLVHRQDVIAAIEQIIKLDKFGLTLHLSALAHPSRQDYYPWCATELGLAPPTFEPCLQCPGKRIDATGTLEELALSLKYPSPFDMLHGLSL